MEHENEDLRNENISLVLNDGSNSGDTKRILQKLSQDFEDLREELFLQRKKERKTKLTEKLVDTSAKKMCVLNQYVFC